MKIGRFVYGLDESLGFISENCIYPFYIFNGLPKYLSYPFAKEQDIDNILSIRIINKSSCVPIENIKFINPIKYPGKIIGLGLNYHDHVMESGLKTPKDIIIFMKPRTALAGPFDTIYVPKIVRELDYEGELALVIGRKGKNINVNDAYKYILGYTVLNDVSARDFQFRDGQWTRGKSVDGFSPIGPWIVTTDEIADPHDLRIRTWVNDELRQDSHTGNMIFKIDEVISRLSELITLEPGDVIATGTPSGVGYFDKSGDKLLKDNDIVRIEIEKIGFIENRFKFI